jgi:hypothetical protein
MSKTQRRSAAFAFLVILLLAAPADAQHGRSPHVRPLSGMQHLVDEAARRSPAIREWLDRLESLDVTVYIRANAFMPLDLEGRVGLLSAGGIHRYLVIDLACRRVEFSQMATLGHELFHAIEIAEEPSVVNSSTLADLYSRIGVQTDDSPGRRTFETQAAVAAGKRARRELLMNTASHGHGT